MRKKHIIILSSTMVVIILALSAIFYYQCTHFNAKVMINDTKVGGLTAEKAIQKLKESNLKNDVYVGERLILKGKTTKAGFTDKDLPEVENLLKKQRTFFPSFKVKSYSLLPVNADQNRSQTMKKKLEKKLLSMNKSLKAPKDAHAQLKQGKIIVLKSEAGERYDVAKLLEDYSKHEYNSVVRLKAVYLQPIKEDSPSVEMEKAKLQELIGRTVDYKVQNKVYSFKGSGVIKNATVSKTMKYTMDMDVIEKKLTDINRTQSTLGKNYTFKTHSGKVISIKGETYGWAINVTEEAKRIQEAFDKGTTSILAYNVYGIGWNVNGVGYHTTTNNGIGDTYAEVSIEDQRIWIYKNGKLQVTTHVVTGRHNTNEDTPKGVWYIMYKRAPSILRGSEVGNPNYSIKVNYWAPFTNSGCGFHDAYWRTNWASDAYLEHGSGGCVNTPPSIMKAVYDNLEQYEPVIIY
ncbi:L,D-transpeptidase family protein [Bacillus sp. FJAT-49736]|uniref:L,D-transpeptidase family protein n=1 Tax=Bacillus sp. FJAT-49736 TaxID=2833582 RepID=UPI001BC9A8AB|nr:L,D-transpeptidase family protein [Bacillus sp. FJAT-49736]MBS4174288.1 L,D-transpeptidase/peptidoglycan binding protein [Bacillus sp. FJAT-49736]